jgi:hypothetical protein
VHDLPISAMSAQYHAWCLQLYLSVWNYSNRANNGDIFLTRAYRGKTLANNTLPFFLKTWIWDT